VGLLLGAIIPAHATTSTWLTTAPSTNWNNTTNWSGGVVPTGTNIAAFATTSAHSAVVINASGLSVGEVTFSGTANESLTGTVANALTLNGVGGVDMDNQEASFAASIGAAINLGTGTQTLQVTGTGTASLTFSNQVNLNGAAAIFKTTTASNLITFSGPIVENGSTGSLAITGSGTVIFSGANTYTEVTSIASGASLQIGAAGATGQLGTGNVVDVGTLVYDLSGNTTVSNVISGAGTLVQKGAGASTVVLTGANTYTGATTITTGAIQLGNGTTNGSIAGTSIVDNAALIYDVTAGSTSAYAGTISGTGTVTQKGSGTLVLTGTNTYTGVTSITAGGLQLGNGTTNGSIAGTSIVDNAALIFDLTGTASYAGTISGTGVVSQTAGTMILKGVNTYTGNTSISGGTLQIGVADAIGSASDVVVGSSGTLNLNGFNDIVGSLAGGGTVSQGSGNLTLSDTNSTTFSGTTTGSGTLTRASTGTLTLTGALNSTGLVSISGGAIQVGNGTTNGTIAATSIVDNAALIYDVNGLTTYTGTVSGTGTVAQTGTGTLVLTGTNTYTGVTSITAGGLQLGNGTTNGSIAGTSIVDNAALIFDLTGTASYAGTISGTGNVVQTAGTMILKGVNTYTGDTTISGGTLQVGVANAIGSASDVVVGSGGTLNLNGFNDIVGSLAGGGAVSQGAGNLTLADTNSTTFSGTTTGSGTLTEAGTGTLTLTGALNSTGLVSISSGAIQVGNGTTNGTIAATSIVDNSALIYNASGAVTYAGTISGTGTVSQTGTGTLIVTGTNTYTGNTTISAGALQIGNGGAAGSIASSAFTDNSALTIDVSNATTLGGAISGSGTLTQMGTGTAILTGNNSYTGVTTISGGTLQVGNGGTSGTLGTNTVTDNGALVFNRTDVNTVAGAISGTGALTQAGTGTVILAANNSYSGVTTISAGALQIGNGGTTGSLGTNTVTDNGSLIFNQTGATTVTNAISGTGTLTQAGTGTVLLPNANTYSGGTTVSAGTLLAGNATAIGGTATNISVASGATFGLTGGIKMISRTGLLTLNSNGLSPTSTLLNSSGTNSYEGNISLSGNATIEENAGQILYVGSGYTAIPTNRFDNTLSLGANTLTLLANVGTPQTPTYELSPGSTVWAPTNIFINTKVTGSGGLIVQGPGTVTLSAQNTNTYGGATWVQSGTLVVDAKAGTEAVSGSSVVIGTSGGTAAAILQTGEAQTGDGPSYNYLIGSYNAGTASTSATSLVMYQNGTFNMNGGAEGFANLTMTGGTINGGTSALNTLLSIANGGTTGITTLASTSTALIENGNLGMGGNVFTYNIASGSTSSGVDLEIDSVIQNDRGFTNVAGGNIMFVKSNTGTLLLQGDNAYSGITDVTGGILAVQNGGALGQSSVGSALANGTVVETGAQLQLQQNPGGGGTNIDVASETLTLNGTGIGTSGSLLNASGSNTWGGFIYLNSASSIKANAGSSLTLGNPDPLNGGNPDPTLLASLIDGASGTSNQQLTFGGAGLITVGGNIIGNIGDVIKTDSGTTILVGADTYTGVTSVAAGALRLTNSSSLHGTSVTVLSGATIQMAQDAASNNINENALPTTISGAGNTGTNGAIENINGSNTYNGAITLAAAAQINADASSTLNVAGTVTNAGNLLTVAGAGNTTITGNISGTGGLTMAGTGTLTLSATPTGSTSGNTYSGVTSVSTGTLSMGQNYQVGIANQVAIASGATATVNNTLQSVGTISGNGTINFGTLAGGSTFGTGGGSQLQLNGASTFNGIFTGTGTVYIPTGASLTLGKNGANVIAVGGVNYNFYDPGLNIVLAGGTLNVNGTNDSFGTLTVTANSTLNFALGTGTNSVIDFTGNSGITGGVVINSGVTLNVSNWVNTVDYFYSTDQPGVRFQMPLNQIVFDTPTWVGSNTTWLTYSDGPDTDHQITPVPEPATYGAIVVGLALGLAGLYSYRRRLAVRAAQA